MFNWKYFVEYYKTNIFNKKVKNLLGNPKSVNVIPEETQVYIVIYGLVMV